MKMNMKMKMTYSIIGFVLALRLFSADQGSVFYNLNLPQAVARSADTHRPVVVKFYADWCMVCKAMDKTTFTNDDVTATLENDYIPIKINVDSEEGRKLVTRFGIRGTPTVAVFNSFGDLIAAKAGYQDSKTFLKFLAETNAPERP